MHRAKLKNKFNNDPSDINKRNYNRHKNYCANLVNREKRKYYADLDIKVVEDNKCFWKKIKPLLSNKVPSKKKMTLIENDEVVAEEKAIAEIMHDHFVDAVENLEREPFPLLENIHEPYDDIDQIVHKYRLHPSIVLIKSKLKTNKKFSFQAATIDEVYGHIKGLDPKTATVKNDISIKHLIGCNDIISPFITNMINKMYNNTCVYPADFKNADVTPIHKDKATTK